MSDLDQRTQPSRSTWLLAFGLGILPLIGFWTYGLFDLDEGFYAAVVAEMNRRGEWITPFYNGQPWFEKPILLYWAAKPTVSLFFNEFGARLPSVIATIGLLGLCSWVLARRGFKRAALFLPPILGSCTLVVGAGRMMLTDPLLSLVVAGSFLCFLESLSGDRRWKWIAGGLLGVSVLAKGPVALPIFVAVAVWTYIEERSLRSGFRGGWIVGTLLFVLAVASWYWPAWIANGELFVQKFLVEQNLSRFSGGDSAHAVPLFLAPIYYPLILLVSMLPWTISVWRGRPGTDGSDPLRRYLWRWAIVWIVFFSISGSKLPHYILPAIPPLAMLAALHLARRVPADRSLPLAAFWTPVVLFALVNVAMPYYYRWGSRHAEVHAIASRVRDDLTPVAAYQLPRRQASKGTGKPQLQETSHPSLGFYLNRSFIEAETLDDLANAPKPLWIITRDGRISTADTVELRNRGFELETVVYGNLFLYRLRNR